MQMIIFLFTTILVVVVSHVVEGEETNNTVNPDNSNVIGYLKLFHNDQRCKNGRDGRDGRDGLNGINGANGKDGKNGLDGKTGKDGKDGLNGTNGTDGRNGRDGTNGKNGRNGTDGRNGKDGKSGEVLLRNWKECEWMDVNDDKDVGLVKNCAFRKNSNSSYLKVIITSNMRIYGCTSCCKRWFVTFNSVECSPVPIDVVEHISGPNMSSNDLLRSRTITGHCKVKTTGVVNVGFNIGNCKGYGASDGYTGWNSATRIFIEEVNPPQ